jgi:hypothetical protein
MEGRGRKSTASLTVVPAGLPSRLEPPTGMSEAQANLWREVVAGKPVEWFAADNAPLLVEYVRAVDTANLLDAMISAQFAGKGDDSLKDLLTMRDREAKRAVSIATKLRLTQQSRYTPQAAATADRKAGDGKKPWQFGSA